MFGKQEKERQARLQRLLQRDNGLPPEEPSVPTGQLPPIPGILPTRPQPIHREEGTPRRPAGKTKTLSALQKKQRRRRTLLLAAVGLAAMAAVAVVTGALGSSLALLGDVVDSVTLSFNAAGAGYPVSTGITQPLRIEELAGGFVELGAEDVAVYSAHGAKVRAFQPGYARPALAVGNTRFCVYNRSGTELRVESRTKTLYTKNFSDGILLAAMSGNGSTAVVTQSGRYAAQVTVYDPLFREDAKWSWATTAEIGTPVALSFATDNHRFAAGCLSAGGGQLCSQIYFMDTNTTAVTASYTAAAGSMVLELRWLSPSRVLAIFDHYAVILNPATGAEAARFDYGGSTLKAVAGKGKNTAFLLAGRSGSTLLLRDDSLNSLAQVLVGQANDVTCTGTAVYVLGNTMIRSYRYNGICNWEQTFADRSLAVLDAAQPLVFTGTGAAILTPPAAQTGAQSQ